MVRCKVFFERDGKLVDWLNGNEYTNDEWSEQRDYYYSNKTVAVRATRNHANDEKLEIWKVETKDEKLMDEGMAVGLAGSMKPIEKFVRVVEILRA